MLTRLVFVACFVMAQAGALHSSSSIQDAQFLTFPLPDASARLHHGWWYSLDDKSHEAIDYYPLPPNTPVLAAAAGIAISSCEPPHITKPRTTVDLQAVPLDQVGDIAQLSTTELADWKTSITLRVGGTWTGRIVFEVTGDGTTWSALSLTLSPGGTTFVTNTSINGSFVGFGGRATTASAIRARMIQQGQGSAVVSIAVKPLDGYGRFVLVDHQNGFSTLYAHLGSIALPDQATLPCDDASRHSIIAGDNSHSFEYAGQTYTWTAVKRSDVLGIVGQSGTTYAHLHFELGSDFDGKYSTHIRSRIDPYGIKMAARAYPPPATKCADENVRFGYYWTACPPVLPDTTPPPNQSPTAGFTMTGGAQTRTNGETLSLTVPAGGFANITIASPNCSSGAAPGCSYDADGTIKRREWTLDGILTEPGPLPLTYPVFPGEDIWSLEVIDDKDARSEEVFGTIQVLALAAETPSVAVSPSFGPPGEQFAYTGQGFTGGPPANQNVTSHLRRPGNIESTLAIETGWDGKFSTTIDSTGFVPGMYEVWAVDDYTGRSSAASTFAVTSATDTWPTYRHDAQRTGRSTLTGPATNSVSALFNLGAGYSALTPMLGSNGLIYITAHLANTAEWEVVAIDDTGSIQLRTGLQVSPCRESVSPPTIAPDGSFYVIAGCNAANDAIGFGPDGRFIWRVTLSGGLSNMVLGADGTLFIASGFWQNNEVTLRALRPDGSERWLYTYDNGPTSGVAVAVAPSGQVIATGVTGFGSGAFVEAHDPGTGALLWRRSPAGGNGPASPPSIAADGTIYFTFANRLFAWPGDGGLTENWLVVLPGVINYTSTPAQAPNGAIRVVTPGDEATAAQLHSFLPTGVPEWPAVTLGVGRVSVPIGEVTIDRNGDSYASLFVLCSGTCPLLFKVDAAGQPTWTYSSGVTSEIIIGGPGLGFVTLYDGSSTKVYRVGP